MNGGEITDMLRAGRGGTRATVDALMPVLYDELHRLARARLAAIPRQPSLDTTGLLHELYLRLIGQSSIEWPDRLHFYGYAATAMRHIMVDHARRQRADKRLGATASVGLDGVDAADDMACEASEWIYLDQALDRLRACNARLVQVVELRVFAGLSMEEIAELLGLSLRTAKRDWQKARLVLHRFMQIS